MNNHSENLSEYQQNYLNYRKMKIAEIQQKYEMDLKLYEQQIYNNSRSFENYLYYQFGQSNVKQLKRRFNQNNYDLKNIYDWLKINGINK